MQKVKEAMYTSETEVPSDDGQKKIQLEKFRLAEDVVTKQGNRILQLQTLKQEAIENEDYMAAKKIKDLIRQIDE